ncbi:MAG: large conductance mechanosensitive channel protein MscL [Leptospirales bacterium]
MFKDFRLFLMRGNVVDMAVGIIIGASFGAIVQSLVSDIIMPPVGLLLGKTDFMNRFLILREGSPASPYNTVLEASKAGAVTLNYGVFLNTLVRFLIVGIAVFFLVRSVNRLTALGPKKESPPPAATKTCPYCISIVPLAATRCPQCTSSLQEVYPGNQG